MHMNQSIANLLQAGAFFGMIFSGYLFLESRHAPSKVELELQMELITMDIKKDAEARAYYFDKEQDVGVLDGPDTRRLANLEDNLDEKYRKQDLIRERLLEMEDSNSSSFLGL